MFFLLTECADKLPSAYLLNKLAPESGYIAMSMHISLSRHNIITFMPQGASFERSK